MRAGVPAGVYVTGERRGRKTEDGMARDQLHNTLAIHGSPTIQYNDGAEVNVSFGQTQ